MRQFCFLVILIVIIWLFDFKNVNHLRFINKKQSDTSSQFIKGWIILWIEFIRIGLLYAFFLISNV